ncbi:molecular chaperone GroEL [Chlamydia muridarum str. Nigg]|uniref:60 kDa chaperonin n=1 Tax=Chlamydia muridarum TaxID=83560 RepID=A0A069ZSV8_CHLMR|nr:variant chaperonin GroEL2 [Chlamydia muridarum]UFW26042.1 molecular chaperone GroEL [Chlamydia trachomatis]AHH23281.1 molecular chaperone GroEL [Chlamydia muridarum str. Nigg3 CMUT3-5]AHH24207.1 molecular chaperone GroEL [Chlamydia muridarum str. Nigg CM972]AID38405.1 molecular chaperone GroEL [Chlamydia muridarum str. Nigg 2 MCR]AIT91035.1 molecular chaperone GroEL [Chlamydia muridarum]
MANSFRNQQQGLQAVLSAARVISQMFSQTIGPYRFGTIVHNVQKPQITLDSQRMLKDVLSSDVFENMGMKLIRDAALQTRNRCGDGAKTTALLIEALLEEGLAGIQRGVDPQEFRKGMLLAEKKIQKIFYREAFSITDLEHLVCVSNVARRFNADIASVLSSAVRYGGGNGYYILEEKEGESSHWFAEEHSVWDFGYASPYFITHAETGTVEYSQVYILVSESPLHSSDQAFLAFLEAVVQAGKTPLVILAEAFDRDLLATLEINQIEGGFPVCAVRVGGKHARESLEDIAVLTGASLLSEASFGEISAERITNHLGFVEGICISSTSLCIPREVANKKRLAAHCSLLQDKLEHLHGEESRAWLRKRLARLSSGEVRICIAEESVNQEELAYMTSSVKAMTELLRSGCLPGGGCSLIRAARGVPVPLSLSNGERAGFLAVLHAVERPFRAVVARSGKPVDEVFSQVFSNADWRIGFNGLTGSVEDIVAQGICDGLSCIQHALHHAVGTVGLLLISALFFASQEETFKEEESYEE